MYEVLQLDPFCCCLLTGRVALKSIAAEFQCFDPQIANPLNLVPISCVLGRGWLEMRLQRLVRQLETLKVEHAEVLKTLRLQRNRRVPGPKSRGPGPRSLQTAVVLEVILCFWSAEKHARQGKSPHLS